LVFTYNWSDVVLATLQKTFHQNLKNYQQSTDTKTAAFDKIQTETTELLKANTITTLSTLVKHISKADWLCNFTSQCIHKTSIQTEQLTTSSQSTILKQ